MSARPPAAPVEKLLTTREVAELLGVHPKTVARYVKRLGLPCVEFGGARRFLPSQVARWTQEQARKGATK